MPGPSPYSRVLTEHAARWAFDGWRGSVRLRMYQLLNEASHNSGGILFWQPNGPDLNINANWQPVQNAGFYFLLQLSMYAEVPRPGIDMPGFWTAHYVDGQGYRYWSPLDGPTFEGRFLPQDKPRKLVVAVSRRGGSAILERYPGTIYDSARSIRWPNRGE